MTGSERQVLSLVRETDKANAKSIGRKMRVSPEYAEELCLALAEDGFLLEVSKGEYLISAKGKEILQPYRGGIFGQTTISSYP